MPSLCGDEGAVTEEEAATLGAEALAQVKPGDVVGLGTGQAATAFIRALGAAVKSGMRVTGVPTSEASATLARSLGIPIVPEPATVDVAVDGADEVDPRLDLVKGFGGALVREKIVAAAARRFIVLVGGEKRVPALGARGRVPVEVVRFALPFCQRRLAELGFTSSLRSAGGVPFITDNGNLILDVAVQSIDDPAGFDTTLRAIPGVVGTGLFIGMADTVLVWDQGRVRTLTRTPREKG
jgi:ribose 5-phosphate isomerase A